MKKGRSGFSYMLISSIGFGTLCLWGKLGYRIGYSPLSLLFVRFAIASVILWCLVLFKCRKDIYVNKRNLVVFLLQGGVAYAATALLYFYSLQYLPASVTTILLYLHPIYTYILSSFMEGIRTPVRKVAILFVVVVGVFMLVGIDRIEYVSGRGLVFGILAGLAYSIYTLSNQFHKTNVNSLVSSAYSVTACAVTMLVILRPSLHSFECVGTPLGLIVALGISVFGTVIGITYFINGVRNVGAKNAAIFSAFEPLSGAMFAVVFLNETLTMTQVAGLIVILLGVTYLQADEKRLGTEKLHS